MKVWNDEAKARIIEAKDHYADGLITAKEFLGKIVDLFESVWEDGKEEQQEKLARWLSQACMFIPDETIEAPTKEDLHPE